MSPTQRTLDWLRKRNWTAEVVERWNRYSNTRKDLFGFIDILAIKNEVLGIQATSTSNISARLKKIRENPLAAEWLFSGARLWVIGWKKYAKPVERRYWRETIREVTLSDLGDKQWRFAGPKKKMVCSKGFTKPNPPRKLLSCLNVPWVL